MFKILKLQKTTDKKKKKKLQIPQILIINEYVFNDRIINDLFAFKLPILKNTNNENSYCIMKKL